LVVTENYHTHTYRCKHAAGDVDDFVNAAIENGLTHLGMSDHTALPDDRWVGIRMYYEVLDGYVNAIDNAREKHSNIQILKGMECEYDKDYESFYREELLGKYNFDYLIGAAHFTPYGDDWQTSHDLETEHIIAYGKYVVKSMESGLFGFIAHPDVFGYNYYHWNEETISCSKDILSAAESLKVPLEINGLGFRKPKLDTPNGPQRRYPINSFWEIATDYDIRVICNSDAHHPDDIIANIDDAFELKNSLGLEMTDTSLLRKQSYLQKA
jgi:histidinol-phosphatase (PHP family)